MEDSENKSNIRGNERKILFILSADFLFSSQSFVRHEKTGGAAIGCTIYFVATKTICLQAFVFTTLMSVRD